MEVSSLHFELMAENIWLVGVLKGIFNECGMLLKSLVKELKKRIACVSKERFETGLFKKTFHLIDQLCDYVKTWGGLRAWNSYMTVGVNISTMMLKNQTSYHLCLQYIEFWRYL